jgi:hypothetical protein
MISAKRRRVEPKPDEGGIDGRSGRPRGLIRSINGSRLCILVRRPTFPSAPRGGHGPACDVWNDQVHPGLPRFPNG